MLGESRSPVNTVKSESFVILNARFFTRAFLSPPQRLKGFFFRVDPLSNVSAGTELQATAESAGASARYHTQDGRHPGETIFQ